MVTKQWRTLAVVGATLSALSFPAAPPAAAAETATAVPKLDLNRLMGSWYELAHLPSKRERRCLADSSVLYALDYKAGTFQMGTFCRLKTGMQDVWNANGQADKAKSGRLRLSRLVFLHTQYWVLATAPDFSWTLVGAPNHKSLALLSRSATLAPAVYADLLRQAAAQGFPTQKLITVSQHEAVLSVSGTNTVRHGAGPDVSPTNTPTPSDTPHP